jgi:signal transduction histidine kinase
MTMSARFGSMRAKTIGLFVGYVVVLCVVYGAFTLHVLRRELAVGHDRVEQTARMVAADIDAVLESGRQRLAMVGTLPGLVYGLQAIQEQRAGGPIAPWTTLHYLFFRSPVFNAGVFLTDANGTVLWTEPPGLPWVGQSLVAVGAVVEARRGGAPTVSHGLAADVLVEGPHVVMALPILGPSGEPEGVLGGIIDLRETELMAILGRLATAENRFAVVTDAVGRTLATTGDTPLLAPWRPPADGGNALVAVAPLAAAPWKVVAGQSRSTALAHLWQLQHILVALGVAVLVGAVAIGGTFVRGLVRAIDGLTNHAETMALGDLSRAVVLDTRHAEIATLARTFERMRVALRQSRLALEQRVEERDELIRLKEEFLANVSHELRTPLNVIVGYAEMLADDEPEADRRDALGRIRVQSERLLTLLGDLMTLSGISTGKLSVVSELVDAREALDRLIPLVQRLRHGRPIDVVWDCPAGLPPLLTDGSRLEQMLTNLATNAFKFTPSGTITIRARYEPAGERVVFDVADTGIGIPAHELPYVFDEFRQVDGSMHRHYEGMGLGLALVKRLAALVGGEVRASSVMGQGSTFSLSFPSARAAQAAD